MLHSKWQIVMNRLLNTDLAVWYLCGMKPAGRFVLSTIIQCGWEIKTMSNDPSIKDGFECFVAPQRINRAVKNARKLYFSPIISDKSDVISIGIDGATIEKLSAKCNARDLEIFKLLVSGYNQTEVAQQLNVSQSNVSRKITKFRKILSASE